MAERIRINIPGGDYDIVIEKGLLSQAGLRLFSGRTTDDARRAVIVTNPTVQALYGQALSAALSSAGWATMPDGEQYKTLDTVAQLYADFARLGLDRSGMVIALGGGVVGDTAGFAAATYMRGVGFVQMPTTLLAMVDSSVGGKVGVDLPQGKNLVGAFKQPEVVLIDPAVLDTLPDSEWRCGMAEVIKHGLLADEQLLDRKLHDRKQAAELIRRAVQVKVDVVQRDPFEKGERAHLNLGHTFAHAVEQVSGYRWPHGEAVAFGLVAASHLSHRLGLCDSALPEEVEDLIVATGLPSRLGNLDAEAIYAAMATDKKWQGGRSRFVLLRGVGQPVIMEGVPKSTVVKLLEALK